MVVGDPTSMKHHGAHVIENSKKVTQFGQPEVLEAMVAMYNPRYPKGA